MAVKEFKVPPDEAVIKLLEDLLDDAKTGELQGIIISGQGPASVFSAHAGKIRPYEHAGGMLATIAVLMVDKDALLRERIRDVLNDDDG